MEIFVNMGEVGQVVNVGVVEGMTMGDVRSEVEKVLGEGVVLSGHPDDELVARSGVGPGDTVEAAADTGFLARKKLTSMGYDLKAPAALSDLKQLVTKASVGSNLEVIKLFIEGGLPPRDLLGVCDSPEVLASLAKDHNLDVSASGSDGFTALHQAAMHNCLENVRALLRLGADPNARGPDGRTPDLLAVNPAIAAELEAAQQQN